MFKNVLIILSGIAACFMACLLVLMFYNFFAPEFSNAEFRVFKQTQIYNEGKMQQLAKYKEEYEEEYERKDPIQREAIKQIIKHAYADYRIPDSMPIGLVNFLREMRGY